MSEIYNVEYIEDINELDEFKMLNLVEVRKIKLTNKKTGIKTIIKPKIIQDKNGNIKEIQFLKNGKVKQKAIPCLEKETGNIGFYMTKEDKFYKQVIFQGYYCFVSDDNGFCLKLKNGKVVFCVIDKDLIGKIKNYTPTYKIKKL